MNIREYQEFTPTTAIYPVKQKDARIIEAMYLSLGLVGEAGEIANKIKKWHRDGFIDWMEERENIADEIGDVLWYISQLCNLLGIGMNRILEDNVIKLESRQRRNKLQGSGDNR